MIVNACLILKRSFSCKFDLRAKGNSIQLLKVRCVLYQCEKSTSLDLFTWYTPDSRTYRYVHAYIGVDVNIINITLRSSFFPPLMRNTRNTNSAQEKRNEVFCASTLYFKVAMPTIYVGLRVRERIHRLYGVDYIQIMVLLLDIWERAGTMLSDFVQIIIFQIFLILYTINI